MKAVIVGGGIAGLASALALTRRGWEVEVLERAASFGEVGAGLSLWPNGLRALDALGVGRHVRERASLESRAGIRDPHGRWLSRAAPDATDDGNGPVAMVHRADLLSILHAAVPEGCLLNAVTVSGVRADGTVVHSEGESRANLVVGADGICSAVRASLWPDAPAPRYAGYTAWRIVTPAPSAPVDGSSESWGRGERFGYAPLRDGRVYCFAVANAPEGAPHGGLAALRSRFSDWHDPIPALLDRAQEDGVLHDDVFELPRLSSYVAGQVALVGDAAHAMTPNLGQGACQALEDAVVLAKSVNSGGGLDTYDQLRRKRTQMIARRSRRIGAAAQWQSPVAVALRNAGLSLVPDSSFARSLASVVDWTV